MRFFEKKYSGDFKIKKETEKWIQLGIELAKNPNQQFFCPNCNFKYLKVQDVESEINSNRIERIIKCPHCKAFNAMRMKKKAKK